MPQIHWHVLTLKRHFEFNAGFVKQVIKAWSESGVMDEDTAGDVFNRAGERNDRITIGRVIWEVLYIMTGTFIEDPSELTRCETINA
jgi:hypothetical protein